MMDDEEQEVMLPDIRHLTGSANADILAGDFRDNTIDGRRLATIKSTAARIRVISIRWAGVMPLTSTR